MASVINCNGRKVIRFIMNGMRKQINLGKLDSLSAQVIASHIASLVATRVAGVSLREETTNWLSGIGVKLRAKLEAVGLIQLIQAKPQKPQTTLVAFLTSFIANREAEVKPLTMMNLEQAKRRLIESLGGERIIDELTVADAEKFATEQRKKYSPATAGRTIKRARQFFKFALRTKLVGENIFADIRGGGSPNKKRQFHVSPEVIEKVIEAAPSPEWKLIVALSRYGGLRCPSETLALKWDDINWARNRFRVDSPKTGERWVPIFPELRPYLDECFELATEGAEYVITRYRDCAQNLRTAFQRIIKRAGEKPWPKLFHNLRASRQTELAGRFPLHVACSWLGNSAAVAAAHYLTVREDDFKMAVEGGSGVKKQVQNITEKGTKPYLNENAASGNENNLSAQLELSKGFMHHSASPFLSLLNTPVPPRGLEPLS